MDEEIKKLLEKNLELTEEIYKKAKYMKRYVIFQQIFCILKILIIVVPIVLGIIYLPPLLKNVYSQYQELLNLGGKVDTIDTIDIDVKQLPPDLLKYVK